MCIVYVFAINQITFLLFYVEADAQLFIELSTSDWGAEPAVVQWYYCGSTALHSLCSYAEHFPHVKAAQPSNLLLKTQQN